jgi:hypothetical protein
MQPRKRPDRHGWARHFRWRRPAGVVFSVEVGWMELLVLAVLFGVGLLALGILSAVVGLLWFVFTLPFRILGWVLHGVLFLLALPFIVIAALACGLVFLLPLGPLLLLGIGAWALVKWLRRPSAVAGR